jgi:hypothetical protein
MKTNPSTVYRWVMAAMDRITAEPARRVLDLELRRLDTLQSAIYANAIEGNLSAQAMYLRIADQRARLLGLYPKEPQVNFNLPAGDQPDFLQINFVTPSRKEPADVTPEPPSPYQDAKPDYDRPAIEGPRPRRTDYGVIVEAPRQQRPEWPSYESQVGEARPSVFRPPPGKRSWMK